jgi:hypothetical protein
MSGSLLKWPGRLNTIVGLDPNKPTYGLFAVPDPTVVLDIGESFEPLTIDHINDGAPAADQLALLTPDSTEVLPDGEWCRAAVTRLGSPAIEGSGETVQKYTVGESVCSIDPVPRTGDVLVTPPGSDAAGALAELPAGHAVELRWHLHPTDQGVLDAVGANVTLVFGMQVASDVTGGVGPFFSEKAPRTAIAQTPDGKLLLVTVDGRQPGWSIGMTPRQLADYLVDLGAIDAANLDGGGSTALAVNQLLVNRPSDSSGERPVGSALVIVPRGTDLRTAATAPPVTDGADPKYDSASIGGWEQSHPG